MTEELACIRRAQQGDEAAFTDLVKAYQRLVYNLCYRMLGELEAAEDAAQETFLKAYRNLVRYDTERSFATWLLSIAAHHCIDQLRRRRFRSFSIDAQEAEWAELPDRFVPDPEAETVKGQESERLHRLLQILAPLDRAAIILRYWYDASEEEIAHALRLTIPAVKSRLHRARHLLAKRWEEETPCLHPERKAHESPAF